MTAAVAALDYLKIQLLFLFRFGAATLDKQRRQNEKCVIAKFELFHPTGKIFINAFIFQIYDFFSMIFS